MIAAPKPLAALSSALLARKGQARPAMRRQATLAEAGDALGWNDMGEPGPGAQPMVEVEPAPAFLEEREVITEVMTATGPKKAFTLRLDADRHMRLRLAAATQRRSAQQIVTAALDAFLAPPSDESRTRPESAGSDPSKD